MTEIIIQELDEIPSSGDDTALKDDEKTSSIPNKSPFYNEYVVMTEETPTNASSSSSSSSKVLVRQLQHGTTASSSSAISLFRNAIHSLVRYIRNLFLPIGYPDTVRDGYWDYQVYDSIQGLCSYLRGVVSSAHVLQAAGVGREDATAWGAAVTWALRDGMGLLGGLAFSAAAAPLFDAHVKEFRFFADISNNVALTLDMLLPVLVNLLPSSFLYMSALSTLCKTMCGMSAGATKGAITQHFAISGNLADLHAKEGTQETLMSLVGMTLGIGLARYFQRLEEEQEAAAAAAAADGDGSPQVDSVWKVQWIVFSALTLLHTWTNYRGVQLLRLRTLNRQRAVDATRTLVKGLGQFVFDEDKTSRNHKLLPQLLPQLLESIPEPTDVYESLATSTYYMLLPQRVSPIVLGAPLVQLIQACCNCTSPRSLLDEFHQEHYVLALSGDIAGSSSIPKVWVSLLTGANAETELQAFVHALLVQDCLVAARQKTNNKTNGGAGSDINLGLVRKTHAVLRQLFGRDGDTAGTTTNNSAGRTLWSQLQARGWELQNRGLHLGFSRRRSRWSVSKSD